MITGILFFFLIDHPCVALYHALQVAAAAVICSVNWWSSVAACPPRFNGRHTQSLSLSRSLLQFFSSLSPGKIQFIVTMPFLVSSNAALVAKLWHVYTLAMWLLRLQCDARPLRPKPVQHPRKSCVCVGFARVSTFVVVVLLLSFSSSFPSSSLHGLVCRRRCALAGPFQQLARHCE